MWYVMYADGERWVAFDPAHHAKYDRLTDSTGRSGRVVDHYEHEQDAIDAALVAGHE